MDEVDEVDESRHGPSNRMGQNGRARPSILDVMFLGDMVLCWPCLCACVYE